MQLFREEALAHSRNRLAGEVALHRSIPEYAFSAFAALLIVVAAAALMIAKRQNYIVAGGFVVMDGSVSNISSQAAGHISKVFVRDGDKVAAGQRLFLIENDRAGQDGSYYEIERQIIDREQDVRRQVREISARDSDANIASERRTLSILLLKKDNLLKKNDLLKIQREIANKQLLQTESLAREGYATPASVLAKKTNVMSFDAQMLDMTAAIAENAADIEKSQASIVSLEGAARAGALSFKSDLESLREKILSIDKDQITVVVSPISGTVRNATLNVGDTVSSGGSLVQVVSASSRTYIDLFAPASEMSGVKIGQDVVVELAGSATLRTRHRKARVTYISSEPFPLERLPTGRADAKTPLYKIRAEVYRENIKSNRPTLPLPNGAAVVGRLIKERQNLLSWLLTQSSEGGE